MNPGKRLTAAASFVRANKKVVDVGTDHAFLPAYLVLTGKTKQCLAVDIGRGPLDNAQKTVEKFALSDRIDLRISDGLQSVHPDEAQDITICGMGGTLMTRILSSCEWIQKEDLHLVLQPQSHVWEVRSFLFRNGFYIDREEILEDAGKLYITISAYYTGRQADCGCGICYFGQLFSKDDAPTKEYVQNLYQHLKVRYDALTKCGIRNEETEFLYACLSYYHLHANSV